ncbi:unnamed protein product, partial [Laminaria digitata]
MGVTVPGPGDDCTAFECEPIKKSSSVAAKVFADRRGSGARSSAASPVSPAYSSGFGHASSDVASPTSTTATDSQPLRGMMNGRRQGDSHLQKIFSNRVPGEGSASGGAGGDSSSQPPSPAASKNSSKGGGGGGGGTGSALGSSSAHWVSSAAAASERGSKPGSTSSAPPSSSSAASLLVAPPSTSSTPFGGRGGGGLTRGPSLVGANGAAPVMPRSVIGRVGDGGGG